MKIYTPKITKQMYGYLKKDFLLLYKRKKYLATFLMLPAIIALIFLMMTSTSTSSIQVGVCNFDGSAESSAALSNLQGFETTILPEKDCLKNLKEQVVKKKIALGIEIGKDFSNELENLKQTGIKIYYDNSDIAFSNLVAWKVEQSLEPFERQIIDSLNSELKDNIKDAREGVDLIVDTLPLSGKLENKAKEVDNDLKTVEEMETEFILNPIHVKHSPINEAPVTESLLAFVFPILALFVILMLASTSIIYDKSTKFITRVKTSSRITTYLSAKLIFFIGLVLVQFLILFLIFLAFGSRYSFSILNLAEVIVAIAIINSLMGFVIGLISENEGIAVLFSLMISFPLMLLSGVFFPSQTLPKIVQWIANILPLSFQINYSKMALIFNQPIGHGWLWFAAGLFVLVVYLIGKKVE